MAEATKEGAAAVTLDQVNQAIAAALKPVTDAITPLGKAMESLTANQKVIADTMAADKARADAAAAATATAGKEAGKPATAAPAPLTAEQVGGLIGDAIKKATAEQVAAQQSSAQRNAFIAEKLKGVPQVYANQLGQDPAKWAEQEAAIRQQFKTDATALGLKVPDVSGGSPGGASPGGATNDQKITQLKAAGLTDGEASFASTLQIPGKPSA